VQKPIRNNPPSNISKQVVTDDMWSKKKNPRCVLHPHLDLLPSSATNSILEDEAKFFLTEGHLLTQTIQQNFRVIANNDATTVYAWISCEYSVNRPFFSVAVNGDARVGADVRKLSSSSENEKDYDLVSVFEVSFNVFNDVFNMDSLDMDLHVRHWRDYNEFTINSCSKKTGSRYPWSTWRACHRESS
jgi:hypothetical protein